MKQIFALLLAASMLLGLTACGSSGAATEATGASAKTLVYGSGDYTRINPAMDEHGEINILLFNVFFPLHLADTPSAAAGRRFDHDRIANLCRQFFCRFCIGKRFL